MTFARNSLPTADAKEHMNLHLGSPTLTISQDSKKNSTYWKHCCFFKLLHIGKVPEVWSEVCDTYQDKWLLLFNNIKKGLNLQTGTLATATTNNNNSSKESESAEGTIIESEPETLTMDGSEITLDNRKRETNQKVRWTQCC